MERQVVGSVRNLRTPKKSCSESSKTKWLQRNHARLQGTMPFWWKRQKTLIERRIVYSWSMTLLQATPCHSNFDQCRQEFFQASSLRILKSSMRLRQCWVTKGSSAQARMFQVCTSQSTSQLIRRGHSMSTETVIWHAKKNDWWNRPCENRKRATTNTSSKGQEWALAIFRPPQLLQVLMT